MVEEEYLQEQKATVLPASFPFVGFPYFTFNVAWPGGGGYDGGGGGGGCNRRRNRAVFKRVRHGCAPPKAWGGFYQRDPRPM